MCEGREPRVGEIYQLSVMDATAEQNAALRRAETRLPRRRGRASPAAAAVGAGRCPRRTTTASASLGVEATVSLVVSA